MTFGPLAKSDTKNKSTHEGTAWGDATISFEKKINESYNSIKVRDLVSKVNDQKFLVSESQVLAVEEIGTSSGKSYVFNEDQLGDWTSTKTANIIKDSHGICAGKKQKRRK